MGHSRARLFLHPYSLAFCLVHGSGLVAKLIPILLIPPWDVAHPAPLSMQFLKQEYCSGSLFPSPGDLSNPGIEPMSPALAGEFFTTEPPGKPRKFYPPTNGSVV